VRERYIERDIERDREKEREVFPEQFKLKMTKCRDSEFSCLLPDYRMHVAEMPTSQKKNLGKSEKKSLIFKKNP
jgi:hypothetical protein